MIFFDKSRAPQKKKNKSNICFVLLWFHSFYLLKELEFSLSQAVATLEDMFEDVVEEEFQSK